MRLLSRQNHQKNLFFIALLLLMPSIAFAGLFLDPIEADFKKAILGGNPGWQTIITDVAKRLFWLLVLVDFTWTTIVYVKDRKEIGEILTSYVGKIFTIGFYWLLLMSANTWMPALIGLFADTGKDVATATGAQVGTLDSVFSQGVWLAEKIMETLAGLSVWERIYMIFPAAFGAFCAAIGFALVAGQLLVTLIESYIAIGAGVIMLGFGGSRWTSDMATSYLKFAVGTGLKLMLCYLIIGLGYGLFNGAIPNDALNDPGQFFTYIFRVVALVLIYVYLVFNIPGLASAMISGSPNMSLGGALGATITAGAAAASGGAALAAGAGKAAALGGALAAEGGGMAKAAGEGFKANKASGMTNTEAALMAPVPMIKSAADMVGAKAAEAGKGVAKGGEGALGKAGDAINKSFGGKVAEDIAAKSEAKTAAKTGSDAPVADAGKTAASAPVDANAAAGNPDAAETTSSVPTSASSGRDAPGVLTIPPPAPKDAATDGKTSFGLPPGAIVPGKMLDGPPPANAKTGETATNSLGDQSSHLKSATPSGMSDSAPGISPQAGNTVGDDVGGGGGGGSGNETPTSSLPETSQPPPSAKTKPAETATNTTLGDKGSQLNDTSGGDASGAKVGASDPQTRLLEAINANMEKMKQMESNAAVGGENKSEQKPKLSEKIQGLQRFVPQDAASVAAAPITMGHTRD